MYYNLTKFYQNRMKNKKVFLIAHFLPISALYGPTAAQWGCTPAQCGKLSLWTYVYDYKPILHWKCCSYNFIIQVAPSLSKTAILLVVLLFDQKKVTKYKLFVRSFAIRSSRSSVRVQCIVCQQVQFGSHKTKFYIFVKNLFGIWSN